jgi:hypothetical protein
MDKNQLVSMTLHEVKELNKDLTIIRVLGGWLYIYKNASSTFVSSRGNF